MNWEADPEHGSEALPEVFTGEWAAGKPEGSGIHTWLATAPKIDTVKHHAFPQQNNRYEGSWHNGARHGTGSFAYSNGATFEGSWMANQKHGPGSFTFEGSWMANQKHGP